MTNTNSRQCYEAGLAQPDFQSNSWLDKKKKKNLKLQLQIIGKKTKHINSFFSTKIFL